MELTRDDIELHDALVAVRDDSEKSKALVNRIIEHMEKLHYALKTRRNFEKVTILEPTNDYAYVAYLDVDKGYRFIYGYNYTFYIKGEPSTYESRNVESCVELYRESHEGTDLEIAEALDGKLFVSIRLLRKWTDPNHQYPTLVYRPLNILYLGKEHLYSVLKMLIAEDIFKENALDIFDIVPKVDYIEDLD